MASNRRGRSTCSPSVDVIDLTEESPVHRSSQIRSRIYQNLPSSHGSTLRSRYTSCEGPEEVLDSSVLETMDAISANRNESRSNFRQASRTAHRVRVRNRASSKSTSHGNKRHRNETKPNEVINLDETASPKHSGPWCVNDSIAVSPSTLICAICLEELSSKHKPTTTRCGHIFCEECLDTVISQKKKCPTCQSNITRKSCTRLYF